MEGKNWLALFGRRCWNKKFMFSLECAEQSLILVYRTLLLLIAKSCSLFLSIRPLLLSFHGMTAYSSSLISFDLESRSRRAVIPVFHSMH